MSVSNETARPSTETTIGRMPVLITYATTRGSTKEVAERIAARLHADGFAVDCRPVDHVYSVDNYSAVILGSAVHSHRWLLDAVKFLDIEAMGLQKRPVWTFSVSMAPASGPRWMRDKVIRKESRAIADAVARKVPKVRDNHLFAGKRDRSHTSFPVRVLYGCIGGRLGDLRDWDEIDSWTNTIAKQLAVEIS